MKRMKYLIRVMKYPVKGVFVLKIAVTIITLSLLCMTASSQEITKGTKGSCPGGICKPQTDAGSFYEKKDEVPRKGGETDIKPQTIKGPGMTGQAAAQTAIPKINRPSVTSPPTTKVTDNAAGKNKDTSETIKNILKMESTYDDNIKTGTVFENVMEILPEVTTKIELSNMDINRVVCPVEIKDVVYSKEKGINVKIQGKNAFVKFIVIREDNKNTYSSIPSEMYIVCGDNVYSVIAYPKRIPSQIVNLSNGKLEKVKKNLNMFSEIPYEKRIMTILKDIFTDKIPDSFSVTPVNRRINTFEQIDLTLRRIITVDGEGLRVKEYQAKLKENAPQVYLREKDFLRTDLTSKTIAVSIDTLNLKKGDTSRILIVEQTSGGNI